MNLRIKMAWVKEDLTKELLTLQKLQLFYIS